MGPRYGDNGTVEMGVVVYGGVEMEKQAITS